MSLPPLFAQFVWPNVCWGFLAGTVLLLGGGLLGWIVGRRRSDGLPENEKLGLLRELSRSEEQFRFIFESVPVGISLKFRERGKNILWHINDEHLRIAGLTREEVSGDGAEERFREITHPEDWAGQQILRDRLDAGEIDRFEMEKRYVHRDGRIVWVAFTTLRREVHGFEIFLNTVVDITAQKDHAAQLSEARGAAELANRAKDRFLATMSHEIRNPLGGLVGLGRLLLDSPLDPEQRDYVSTIVGCTDSLMVILDDILDLSKIEAGQMELEDRDFSLRDCIGGVTRLIFPQAKAKGLSFLCDLGDGLPERIRGDEAKLRQILINLIGNAVKFTARGTVGLTVLVRGDAVGPRWLDFEVRDTGAGIPEELIGQLFAPYRQADPSISRRFGGTGLGLSIVKRLLGLMGGDIRVESRPADGTRFLFSIPLVESISGT